MTSDDTSVRVLAWWGALSLVAALNICVWIRAAAKHLQKWRSAGVGDESLPHWQLILSGVFVFGCAFRSFLPRSEGQRICLYGAWISCAMVGRAVATVAELSLIAQLTIVLRECADEVRSLRGMVISYALLPLISVAEVFSWYSALSTNFIGSVVEESIWAITAMLFTGTFGVLWSRLRGPRRALIRSGIVLGLAYVTFMWTVDVPMYWSRWNREKAAGKVYVPLQIAWRDAQERVIQTRRWVDWRQEIPWMSLYFSLGVWISIALVDWPGPRSRRRWPREKAVT